MSLPGYDAWLERPYREAERQEVDLNDVVCEECKLEQDVTAYSNSDEAEWECVECGHDNVAYWDDDPIRGRGWNR